MTKVIRDVYLDSVVTSGLDHVKYLTENLKADMDLFFKVMTPSQAILLSGKTLSCSLGEYHKEHCVWSWVNFLSENTKPWSTKWKPEKHFLNTIKQLADRGLFVKTKDQKFTFTQIGISYFFLDLYVKSCTSKN